MKHQQDNATVKEVVELLRKRCPRLVKLCYWAGTSCIAIEELGHRQSFDLDFHTRRALEDVRPILSELRAAFPGKFELLQAPDEFGSGFRGVLKLGKTGDIVIEVFSNFDDVADAELEPAKTVRGMKRVTLAKYLSDKMQCIVERSESRDLVDIMAVLRKHPTMESRARRHLAHHDAALLVERLLAWTDPEIRKDLRAYKDVDPTEAMQARDLLMAWAKGRK